VQSQYFEGAYTVELAGFSWAIPKGTGEFPMVLTASCLATISLHRVHTGLSTSSTQDSTQHGAGRMKHGQLAM
jgi:hypothetical protein